MLRTLSLCASGSVSSDWQRAGFGVKSGVLWAERGQANYGGRLTG